MNLADIINKIERFKIATYPLGKENDYSQIPRTIGMPTWSDFDQLKEDINNLEKANVNIKSNKRKTRKPHSGGFNKPIILNKKMSKIITTNALNADPKFEYDNDNVRVIYTRALLTNWWAKYIERNKLRNEKYKVILVHEGLLKKIATPILLRDANINLNARPEYKRLIKGENESNKEYKLRKLESGDHRFTFANLQRILSKYVDKTIKDQNYEDYDEYFTSEKYRLDNYKTSLTNTVMKPKKRDKTSAKGKEKVKSKSTPAKKSLTKEDILKILNEEESSSNENEYGIDIEDIEDF